VYVVNLTALNMLSALQMEHSKICHNDIQYLAADLLSEVCHDVSTEPSLQLLSGKSLSLRTANCDAGARLDIKASGFWGCRFHPTFFDVRIFNPYAPTNMRI